MAAALVLAGMATGPAGCTATVVEVEPAGVGGNGAVGETVTGNPGTLVPPTVPTTQAPYLLDVEPLIAFMAACVGELESGADGLASTAGAAVDLAGPCHCAATRMQPRLTALDVQVFEDRLTGNLEFSPELAVALEGCAAAEAPPPWTDAERSAYLARCTAGSDRLSDLCVCSLARAQQIVPASRLADFLASTEVQPGIVDFVNLCV